MVRLTGHILVSVSEDIERRGESNINKVWESSVEETADIDCLQTAGLHWPAVQHYSSVR